jgi:hypothetical protein
MIYKGGLEDDLGKKPMVGMRRKLYDCIKEHSDRNSIV